MTEPPSSDLRLPRRPRRARRVLFAIALALGVAASLELVARAYLRLVAGGSLLHPDHVFYGFYPELRRVEHEFDEPREGACNILFLGASVLDPHWSAIEALLAERLTVDLRRPVRIHNLAAPSHTTRDSLLKYQRLRAPRFDLVVVYHGINDARANNVPREVFRDDYGHYSWYRYVNAADRDRWLPYLALPHVATRAWLAVSERFGLTPTIAETEPRPEWRAHGTDVKSVRPFRANLTAILEHARARGEPVLLMTFALHLPEGYTDEAFDALKLDYTRHRSPLPWWGSPAGVGAGVAAHNAVIRELAASYRTELVDQAALVPGERKYFDDVCHLTVAGSQVFVDNMLPAVERALAPQPPR